MTKKEKKKTNLKFFKMVGLCSVVSSWVFSSPHTSSLSLSSPPFLFGYNVEVRVRLVKISTVVLLLLKLSLEIFY